MTFLVDNRDAGSKAGYVATAFWGGLMLGRVLLMPVNIFVGEQRVVWLYLGIATALEVRESSRCFDSLLTLF